MNEGLQDESEQHTLPEPSLHAADTQKKESSAIVNAVQVSNTLMRGGPHQIRCLSQQSPGGSEKVNASSKKLNKYSKKSIALHHQNNLISDQDNHDHQFAHQMSCGMNAQPDLLNNDERINFFDDDSSPHRKLQNSSTLACSSSVDFGHPYKGATASLHRAQSSTVCTVGKSHSAIGDCKVQIEKSKPPQQYVLATQLNQKQSLLQSNNNEQYFLFSTEENPSAQNQSKISFGQSASPPQLASRRVPDTIAHYFLDENEEKGHEQEEHYEDDFEYYNQPQKASNISRSGDSADNNLISAQTANKNSSPNGVVVLHSNYLLLNNDEEESDLIDQDKLKKEDNEAHSQSFYLQPQNDDQENILTSPQANEKQLGEYFIDNNDVQAEANQEECSNLKNPLDQENNYIPPILLQSQASSHSTVFAEEDHHIQSSIIKVLKLQQTNQVDPTKSYSSAQKQNQNFQTSSLPKQSSNLAYHSMDIPSHEKKSSSRRRAQLQTALMNSNLFIDDSQEYDEIQKKVDDDDDDDERVEQHKSIFEGLHIHQPGEEELQVFGPASLLFNNDLLNEVQQAETEEQKRRYFLQDAILDLPSTLQPESARALLNQETKAANSLISHGNAEDQEAVLMVRGRTSVLEEVEDDDLVNQNSSKSSSRSQSENKRNQPFSAKVLTQILQKEEEVVLEHQSQSNLFQGMLHHELLEIEEEIKSEAAPIGVLNLQRTPSQQLPIQNTQQNVPLSLHKTPSVSSKSSKKRSTKGRTGSESGQNHGQTRFTYFAASGLSDDRWLCPICLDIFEDAVETPCCHNLFCEACIKRTPTCPLCNMRINPLDGLKPNIPIRRLVLELSVSCPNEDCDNIIRKGEIDKHMKVCPYTLVECPNTSDGDVCGKILRKNIERHKTEECPFRIVECLLKCELMLPLNDMEDHIANDCPKTIIACKNKCGGLIERGEMDKHINVDCPLEIVDCPNKGDSLFEEGCQARLKRKEMESHKVTCNYRKVHCPNQKCNAIIVYKDLPSHDERCLFKIVECENKCGHRIQRQHIDRHRDQCEFQLVKCPYFDHGCKIEVLRKEYVDHLKEEGFAHSILFIEGQKRKNREIDELKNDLMNMRQNYDVEIQAMFMEMNRVKEDLMLIKSKTGIGNTANNHHSQRSGQVPSNTDIHTGPKMILGVNSGIGGGVALTNTIKRDERRYGDMPVNSSAGSSLGGFFEHIPQNIYRRLEQRGFIMSGSQAQQNQGTAAQEYRLNASVAQTQQYRVGGNQRSGNNNNNNALSNNSGSLDSLMQSIGGSSFNQNMISSMQYTSNTFGQQAQINPFTGQPNSANRANPSTSSNTLAQPSNTIFASANPFFTQNMGPQRRPGNGGMQDAESDDGVNTSSILTRNGGGGGNVLGATSGMFSFRGGQQNNQLHSSSHLLILGEHQNSSQHSNSLEHHPNTSNTMAQQLSSQINVPNNNNNNQTFNFNGCNRSQHSSSQFQLFGGENVSRTRAPLVPNAQQNHSNSQANGPQAVRQRRPAENEQERKQSQMALFLGSIDSSQESNQQNRQQQQLTSALLGQSYKNSSPTGSSLDFWQLSSQNNGIPRVADTIISSNITNEQAAKQLSVSGRPANNTTNMLQASMKMLSVVPSQSSNNFGSQSLSGAPCGDAEPQFRQATSITQSMRQQSNMSGAARGVAGGGGSGSISGGPRQQLLTANNNVNQQEDLDSSNVLYDDDFEIEEESKNNNNNF